jgi:hypothetical protein
MSRPMSNDAKPAKLPVLARPINSVRRYAGPTSAESVILSSAMTS